MASRTSAPLALDPERRRELAKAVAAYQASMDAAITETRYHLGGEREDIDRQAYLGGIIERAAARQRARENATGGGTR